MPSLVSSLGTLGYSKTAFHPYYGANWQRERVYPLLGFEDYISIEDLFGEENVAQYREDGNFLRYSQEVSEMYPDQVTSCAATSAMSLISARWSRCMRNGMRGGLSSCSM